jgi:hypothetical protein
MYAVVGGGDTAASDLDPAICRRMSGPPVKWQRQSKHPNVNAPTPANVQPLQQAAISLALQIRLSPVIPTASIIVTRYRIE